jgi:hypothetical protein
MNVKAAMEDVFPDIDYLKRWFRDTKGKELQKSTKPCLTEEQKAPCIRCCNRIKELKREEKNNPLTG